ncbi:MAG: APC family permease, partial [Chitinophagaceae bacterium]
LLVGAWCLTGFEAAADLAEETRLPTRNVPRAVILSHVVASVSGLLIILFLLLNIGGNPPLGGSNLLLTVLQDTLGPRFTAVLLLLILLSIFACAVAAMATVSRLVFSLSRDRLLPYSSWISKVEPRSQTPRNAILLIWGLSTLAILIFKKIEIITNISVLATYLGYAGIMLAALVSAKQRTRDTFIYSPRWERTIQATAFVWSVFIVLALAIPETTIEGYETRHLPALSTFLGILAGCCLYFFYVQKRIRSGSAGPPKLNNS